MSCSNVQVTLQILTALIEKTPRDLSLYSPFVLRILLNVLRSQDLTMVEATIPTFEMFCKHQDTTALAADQDRASLYSEVMKMYATFASEDFLATLKTAPSTPVKVRWRTAGLEAIRSIVGCEIPTTFVSTQFATVMPAILENLAVNEPEALPRVHRRMQSSEKQDIEHARKRRQSMSTVQTVDESEGDAATAGGTAADADRAAEEEVRILALRCLKQIFVGGSNRGLILTATRNVLKFIVDREHPHNDPGARSGSREGNWGTSVLEMCANWAPVQDRFIIIVTAVEQLVSSPVVEENLVRQLALVKLIDWLLSSNINMIGLSVIDVLLGFVQHVLRLLQLGGRDAKVLPHHQQPVGPDFGTEKERAAAAVGANGLEDDRVPLASPLRQELVVRLRQCIADLATHIYYTDQISDMIISILAQLRPSPNLQTTVAAIENPSSTASAAASSSRLHEDPTLDSYFSFSTARVTALNAVKDVLVVANKKKSATGTIGEARNAVSVHVWEGTQWLLRDEDREVRRAYVGALLTWLNLETNANDLKITKETRKSPKTPKRDASEGGDGLVRRAVSNASQKGEPKTEPKMMTSNFLKLLHLAIYDNAIESAESQPDVLLLHLLMVSLVENLGVNATTFGLPMIFRLQEDINLDDVVPSPTAKMNIGSLCHGYFWALSEKFNFDTTPVGAEINNEIMRRRSKKLWLDRVQLPPLPLESIQTDFYDEKAAFEILEHESLLPFDGRSQLIDQIATSYDSVNSPPASPPTSPGRGFSIASLAYAYTSTITAKPAPVNTLPSSIRDQLSEDWTKEACIASIEEKAQSVSLSGSKTGTASRHFLAVNGDAHATSTSTKPERPPSIGYGLVGGLGAMQKIRHASMQDDTQTPVDSSSRESTIRVDELRRALNDNPYQVRHFSPLRGAFDDADRASVSSDSMVSAAGYSVSDAGTSANVGAGAATFAHGNGHPTPIKEESNPVSRASSIAPDPEKRRSQREDDIPPVPPLPMSLTLPGGFPMDTTPTASVVSDRPSSTVPGTSPGDNRVGRTTSVGRKQRSYSRPNTGVNGAPRSRSRGGWAGGYATSSGRGSPVVANKIDLAQLLGGISSGNDGVAEESDENAGFGGKGLVKPPY